MSDVFDSSKAQSATVALFVSDIHLDVSRARTSAAFLQFLQQVAPHCQQLYLLGDIFEYWPGDDDSDAAEHVPLIQALQALHLQHQVQVFWLAGNRDFLVGQAFAQQCHLQILQEPFLLHIANAAPILLMHGDALCTDDAPYMAFRAQVRQAAWQSAFLSKPLEERKSVITAMRKASQAAQQGKSMAILDVNQDAVNATMQQHGCSVLLHGHTHRPACHHFQQDEQARTRHVLPDWECDVAEEDWRGGWIALQNDGELCHVGLAPAK